MRARNVPWFLVLALVLLVTTGARTKWSKRGTWVKAGRHSETIDRSYWVKDQDFVQETDANFRVKKFSVLNATDEYVNVRVHSKDFGTRTFEDINIAASSIRTLRGFTLNSYEIDDLTGTGSVYVYAEN